MSPHLQHLATALFLATLVAPVASQAARLRTRGPAHPLLQRPGPGDQPRVLRAVQWPPHPGRSVALLYRPGQPLRLALQPDQGRYRPVAGAGTPGPGTTVRCESFDNRAQTAGCRGPGRRVSSRRLPGSSACTEGVTWQSQQGQVYVGRNCRAEFASAGGAIAPLPGTPGTGQVVRCESFDNQAQICRVPWTGASRLSRQLPGSSACTEGVTWQSQQSQVYVGRNCRAEFVAGRRGQAAADRPA